MRAEVGVRYVFGTAPECAVVIQNEYVSRRHAQFYVDEQGQVWVEDLGSVNGSFVLPKFSQWPVRVEGPMRIFPGDAVYLSLQCVIPWSEVSSSE